MKLIKKLLEDQPLLVVWKDESKELLAVG